MKMAITEFINFNSIPVKVTINEYLEIAKEFSTPKSNSFINGILDKILFELKAGNRIRKTGRGLIE
jgi:N utilization substance protein B